MIDIVPTKPTLEEIETICWGKTIKGKKVPGFNVWTPDVVRIMESVSDGRYLINGFRNKDIAKAIFSDIQDTKKRSSRTIRTLKKLRQHAWAGQKGFTFQTIPCYLKGQTDHGCSHRAAP